MHHQKYKENELNTNKMESREPLKFLEGAQDESLDHERQTHTTISVLDSGLWMTEEIKVDIKTFPSRDENPALHYPHDWL